ncbi:MAG: FixH family protein [Rhodospirillales bacterium]|nr:FixH family protein [Rhodospirillales bacterium]
MAGEAMARVRQPGWWYPWIFVAVMAVVIAVNVLMATLAVRTFPGLQTEDAYNKGLRYNDTIAAVREQAKLGWRMSVEVTPTADADGPGREAELTVAFVDRDGQPLDRLSIDAALLRPAAEGFDRALSLDYRGSGVYVGTVTLPLAGQWDAHVMARRDSDTFEATRRLFIP